ncbi:hypothetical protein BT63DRAFT_440017 [Microthyrium microscopicum]|uniref:PRISE-like Rossmann-fold domain-containing protein n=1 Tax=Microthyrium microscopicum TaxID=703497 RepID=A0A6A6UBK9_9PEZI|nr:hypothetical protein BT63DRAFT_440017 [Microthyrium microscopicum]
MSSAPKVALVFGASGVTGWSFVNEILNDYPKKGIWGKVYALTNRPLKEETTIWPKDDRLEIVSGIDLLKGSQEDLEKELKSKIKDISKVTHVYYLAYKANPHDLKAELDDAVAMWSRSTIAMDHISPSLEFVILQTGAKMYGCHLLENHPTDYIHPPLHENLPRLKQPYHDQLFYHPQLDWAHDYAKGKAWKWCDTRPDIIIGFHPTPNFYSLGQVLGIYMTLFRAVEGAGAECPWPGTKQSWVAKSHDSSSDMIARQTLHLSLTIDDKYNGTGFNVGDAKQWYTWETKWPAICKYFGLKGVGPESGKEGTEVRAYIKEHLAEWKKIEKEHGLQSGFADSEMVIPGFEFFLITQFDFDRQYDMTKMYDVAGFKEERTPAQTWGGVFDRMRKAKIIP